ncbi:hypothetical protein AB0M50_06500 [Nonomuraea fuscirosea]|uniref:hypothetical protein n=1 Tax=Nonomuraea fuscirosea TaxID=1291556 RepID=UPI003445F894
MRHAVVGRGEGYGEELWPKVSLAQFGKEIGMDVTIEDAMVHPLIRECVEYGQVRGVLKAVLMILDMRNIQVSSEARRRILACRDLETLKTWIDRSIVATSVDELFD